MHNFGPNWFRFGHLFQKDIFFEKSDCYFCAPVVLCRAKAFKRNLCSRIWDIRFHNFGLNWSQIAQLPQKGIFLRKLTNVTLVHMLCFVMIKCFKKILTANYEIKGYIILDQFGSKLIIWEIWENWLMLFFPFYFFVRFKKIFRVDHDI